MKRFIFVCVLTLTACATSPNSRTQTIPQTGLSNKGNVQNVSSQNDSIVGNGGPVTINYNYAGFSKDQMVNMLQERDARIEVLSSQVAQLKANAPGVFKFKDMQREMLKDGKYKTTINLSPIGRNVIPLFTVEMGTTNGSVIESMEVTGDWLKDVVISHSGQNPAKTLFLRAFEMVRPSDTQIIITTDKDPGKFSAHIEPLQE